MRKHLILVVMLAALTVLPTSAYAAPPTPHGNHGHGDEVRAYWTADRMARATARDYVLDDHGHVERGQVEGKGSNPNGKPSPGGGGGGSTTTTGSSWTASTPPMAWATGRVYFTMSGSNYTCSASIVQQSVDASRIVVLSAGHCVYDEVNDQFATNWMFIPNYDKADTLFTGGGCAAAPQRCWVANSLVASKDWADSTASTVNFRSDYAFAVFTDAPELAGFAAQAYSYPLIASPATGAAIAAFGYPAEGKYNGTDLIYCAGATVPDPSTPSTNWGLPCNMNGGASGGGWFATFPGTPALASLNSYTYRSIKDRMFGPRFTGATIATYQQALTTTANVVYAAPQTSHRGRNAQPECPRAVRYDCRSGDSSGGNPFSSRMSER